MPCWLPGQAMVLWDVRHHLRGRSKTRHCRHQKRTTSMPDGPAMKRMFGLSVTLRDGCLNSTADNLATPAFTSAKKILRRFYETQKMNLTHVILVRFIIGIYSTIIVIFLTCMELSIRELRLSCAEPKVQSIADDEQTRHTQIRYSTAKETHLW